MYRWETLSCPQLYQIIFLNVALHQTFTLNIFLRQEQRVPRLTLTFFRFSGGSASPRSKCHVVWLQLQDGCFFPRSVGNGQQLMLDWWEEVELL